MIEMITKLKVSVQNHGLIVPDGGIHRGKEKRTAGGGCKDYTEANQLTGLMI